MNADERPGSEHVAPEGVHSRSPASGRSSSVWFGGIVIAVLVAAGALVALGGLDSGDPGGTANPGASTAAIAPEPSTGPTPSPTTPGEQPGIQASVILIESCYLPKNQVPTATRNPPTTIARFDITWDGKIPIWQIEMGLDGEPWQWMGQGDVDKSGTLRASDYPTAGEPHFFTVRFYEDTGENVPGPLVLEVNAPVEVNPAVICNPDWSMPTSSSPPGSPEPLLPPAQDGQVLAIASPLVGTFTSQVEVVRQCLEDEDTAVVTFRVSWFGDIPIDRVRGDIGNALDDRSFEEENELGADGRFGKTDSYERTVNVRVRRPLLVLFNFFRELTPTEPDATSAGRYFLRLAGPALFDPQHSCT